MSDKIIREFHIAAKKALGQNFLVDQDILQKIAGIFPIRGKNIVEVGPGYGALTYFLIQEGFKKLSLVELDKDMVEILNIRKDRGDFGDNSGDIQIFQEDILAFKPSFQEYLVIANIPYYITSPILRHFLYDLENTPEKMSILMQKDVAEKICKTRKNKSSVLSLMIEKKSYAKEVLFVPAKCFSPVPKVDSSVVVFEGHNVYNFLEDDIFLRYIKTAFSSPRKKLVSNIKQLGIGTEIVLEYLEGEGFSTNIRAEDLDIRQWCNLIVYIEELLD